MGPVTSYARFLTADYFRGGDIGMVGSRAGPMSLLDRSFIPYARQGTTAVYTDYFETSFRLVSKLGKGAFAEAFKVQSKADGRMYAVKKTRHAATGKKDRLAKLEEDGPRIVKIINAWEQLGHIYVQMELCERGTLYAYLEENCRDSPLDEFKIWTVLCEVAQGLRYIHGLDIIHLDLKPGNLFITEERSLKIGISVAVWKPSDIFSLGLIILEMMANIILPENGPQWQKLEDDFSESGFWSILCGALDQGEGGKVFM
ncbi:kinase-like domain-containing protein [Chytridium lagenaria]|nr:kinase-like domain-containing protein [Chytridium lagenaria]